MGRLVDIDVLMESLNKSDRDARTESDIQGYCDGWNDVVEIINEQPTAYDVEKVVAELEKAESVKNFGSVNSRNLLIPLKDAIGIVRKGGVE